MQASLAFACLSLAWEPPPRTGRPACLTENEPAAPNDNVDGMAWDMEPFDSDQVEFFASLDTSMLNFTVTISIKGTRKIHTTFSWVSTTRIRKLYSGVIDVRSVGVYSYLSLSSFS